MLTVVLGAMEWVMKTLEPMTLSRQMTVMQGMKLSLAERPVPSYRTTFVIAP